MGILFVEFVRLAQKMSNFHYELIGIQTEPLYNPYNRDILLNNLEGKRCI
jgi:hypothetical protein